jgi:translation initiation factor IF-1
MKNLIIALIALLPMLVQASDNCSTTSDAEQIEEQMEIKTDVPSHLKGATIIVRLADGKETAVPAEKFKVVPRKQQYLVTKTKQLDKMVCGPEKNRISLLAGKGQKSGLDRKEEGDKVTIETRNGVVGGAQYQRLVTDKISLGAQVQTNKTVLVNIGLDF